MHVEILRKSSIAFPVKAEAMSRHQIAKAYQDEGKGLPLDHVWRTGRATHAEQTSEKVGTWCMSMDIPADVTRLISLASYSHDVGRLPQAKRQIDGEKIEPTDHGQFSIDVLSSRIRHLFSDEAWNIFAEAVIKHSLRHTPPLKDFSSSEAWAVCCVVRDFDKSQGFDSALAYTADRENMQGHAKANRLLHTTSNPTAETGAIDTLPGNPDVLGEFLSGRTITRAHCASYEAFMLQYLAWLYDFNVVEVREKVIVDGGPGIVLSYLRTRLGSTSDVYKAIARQAESAWGLTI